MSQHPVTRNDPMFARSRWGVARWKSRRIIRALPRLRSRRGFALITTLWLVVAIATISLEFSLQARERRRTAINVAERGQALAAAAAGVATVQAQFSRLYRENMPDPNSPESLSDAGLYATLHGDPLRWADSLFSDSIELGTGAGSVKVIVRDGGTYVNPRMMNESRWRDFLVGAGVDYGLADQISQAIMDWTDPDNDARGRGAERQDYIRAGRIVLPQNRPLSQVSQLKDVMGMTPDIFASIAPYISMLGDGQININKAEPPVLRSLPGVTDNVVAAIMNQRYAGVQIRTIEELQRLVPGASNDQFTNPRQRRINPLIGVVEFRTQTLVVRSIGLSIGGNTRVIMEAAMRIGQVPDVTILGRRIQ